MVDVQREARFGDPAQGSGLLGGLQSATALPDTFTRKDIKRNLKPFKKFGVPQKIQKFARKTDTQLENIAANAIVRRGIKRGGIKRRKLRTSFNKKKFGPKKIAYAKRVMSMDNPRAQQLKRTKATRRHIRQIRRNRIAMSKPLFSKDV